MGIARRKNIPFKRRHTICGSNFIDTTRHRFVQSTALVFIPHFVISSTGDDYDDGAEERLTSEVLFTRRNTDDEFEDLERAPPTCHTHFTSRKAARRRVRKTFDGNRYRLKWYER